MPFMKHRVD